MRKLYILILLLVIGAVAEAQPTYWNAQPTGGGNVFPFGVVAATGKKVQWVITPAGSSGGFNLPAPAPAGNNITSIWFWTNSAGNATYTNLTVRMATVPTTQFLSTGAWYTGPMTTVRAQNTTLAPAAAATWVNIPLTTPYLYDPTMNLIIEVSQCGFTGTGFSIRQQGFGAAPNYRRQYSDASSVCGVTVLPTGGDLNVAGIGISVVPAAAPCAQNFDAVAAPALPLNWTASTPTTCAGSLPWATTNTVFNSAPNSAFSNDPNCISDEVLDSRTFPIVSPTAQLSFRNRYDLESTFDGMVLEISIGGGPFTGIITAGGSFVTGGYNSTISAAFGSPISGQQAWSGNSGGFITTTVNLPAAANGQNVILRWRRATDNSVSGVGAWVDDVTLTGSNCVAGCIITCPANIIVPNTPNQCGAIVNYPAPTTNGACGPVTAVPASGSFFPVGITTVTVSTFAGPSCTFTVRVNDVQPPTITCPANITVGNGAGLCGAIVNFAPTATDNCPVVVTSVPASGSLFPVGTTTVISTATDAGGNTATCSFTVTVVDNQPPTITCPANITRNNDPNLCSAVVTYALPVIGDNCPFGGGTPTTLSQTSSQVPVAGSVSCNAGGLHTDNSYFRNYPLSLSAPLTITSVQFGIELANASGVGTTQPVTVRVYNSPVAFPAPVASLGPPLANQTFNVPDQTLSLFTATFTTPPSVPANANLVIEVFTPSGQAAGHSFFIGSNAQPETAPSYLMAAACGVPNPVTVASLGFPNMHTIINVNGLVANPASALTQIAGLPSGAAFPVGVTTNTFRVTDAAGNTATCSFTVTVVDNQLPVFTSCPASVVRNTDLNLCYSTYLPPQPTFTDNCGVTNLTWQMTGATVLSNLGAGINYVPSTQFQLNGRTGVGVTTVTYRAYDAAGNLQTCVFTVTVNDAQIPVIVTQPATKFVCVGSPGSFSVDVTTNGGPINYQWQEWNGTAWVNITGANAAIFTIPAVSFNDNTRTFRCFLSGRCTDVISGTATLYINPLPSVSLVASIPPSLVPGQVLNISSNVSPGGGTYRWFKNGVMLLSPLQQLPVLSGLTVNDIGTYRLVYTDLNGCVNTSADMVVSGQASDNLWVYPVPNDGTFQVRFFNQSGEGATVRVFDAKGSKVYERAVVTSLAYTSIVVDLGTAVTDGVYIVDLVNGAGKRVGVKKIVVRRKI